MRVVSIRDLDIDINLDVDASELRRTNREIDDLVRSIQRIDDDIRIDAGLRDNDALEDLRRLRNEMRDIDRSNVDIDIHTDFANTLAQLEVLEAQVNELDGDDIFINVDSRARTRDILALRAHLKALEQQAGDIDVDLDTAGAHAQLALLQTHINGIRGPNLGGSSGGGFGKLLSFEGMDPRGMAAGLLAKVGIITALVPLLPAIASTANVAIGAVGALGVAVGTLSMGALGLVSALGVAGIGVMGFGMIAGSTIGALYEENAKLTAEQQRLKVQTDGVVTSWNNLKTSLQGVTFDAVSTGAKTISKLLKESTPFLKNAGKGVNELFSNLNKSLKGSEMKDFFSMMRKDVKPLTLNLGNGLGNALKGVLNVMVAIRPLTRWVSKGFEGMMGNFSKWTEGLKTSKAFKGTMQYVKDNMPKLGSGLGNMTLGIVDFFRGFSGISTDGFTWFQNKMQEFADWSANLDSNTGFQEFLKDIKDNAPTVGGILKDLGSTIGSFWKMMTDDEGGDSALDKIRDITKAISDFANNPAVQKIMNGAFKLDFGQAFGGIGDWFKDGSGAAAFDSAFGSLGKTIRTKAKDALKDALKGATTGLELGKIKLGDIVGDVKLKFSEIKSKLPKIDFGSMLKNFKLPKFNFKWPSLPKFNFKWPKLPSFKFPKLPSFKFPKLPSFRFPRLPSFKFPKLPSFKFPSLPKFKWPSLPKFKWPSLPKFSWPSFPRFSWPAFPKFSWPKMPKLPGFSSGLGRVPQDMDATVHKDETILQAHNAELLRKMGILKGDGRNPTLDMNAMNSGGTGTTNTTTITKNNAVATSQPVINVSVNVTGGNTNGETGNAVASAIESLFANFRDVFPAEREV